MVRGAGYRRGMSNERHESEARSATRSFVLNLPADLVEQVDRTRASTGESRSDFVRRALVDDLERRNHAAAVRRYVKSYASTPEPVCAAPSVHELADVAHDDWT